MKTVLVTGATRGLGLAVASRLARDGFRVVATGRTLTEPLDKVLGEHPHGIEFMPFDMSDVDQIAGFVKSITDRRGHIFGLVNNAAIGLDGILGTMHNSDIERVLRVNSLAPIILTKYVSRSMTLARCGRIINISSIIAEYRLFGVRGVCGIQGRPRGVHKISGSGVGSFEHNRKRGRPGLHADRHDLGVGRRQIAADCPAEPLEAIGYATGY